VTTLLRLVPVLRLVPLLAFAPFAAACSDGDAAARPAHDGTAGSHPAAAENAGDALPVTVATLHRGPMEAVLRFSTNLEAESSVAVLSQATRRVEQLQVEEGDRVRKGQLLLRLQDDEQRTSLAKVQSQLDKTRREYERQKRMHAAELISEQAMNDATYEIEQLELALDEARRQLSYTEVLAPISGTVTRRLVSLGDHVTPNQHLFDLVDFDSIVALVHVPEKELPRLKVGQPARISAPALGGRIDARIERLSPVVDPRSGTVKVTVDVPHRPGLRPGMYVDVELVVDRQPDSLLVPKRALVYDTDQVYVFRLKGGTVERLLVRPALEDAANVQPTPSEGGLAEGDRVVVAGQAGLKDGDRVRLTGAAPKPGAKPGAKPEPGTTP
jgi:membrane fusion protein, multidrug efflux system